MKYLFDEKSSFSSTFVEYDTDILDVSFETKESIVGKIKGNKNYYRNASISGGLLKIDDKFIMPSFETSIDGEYIKHQGGILYVWDEKKRCIMYTLTYSGKKENWYVCKYGNEYIECNALRSINVECKKVKLLGTDIKTLEQVKRLIILRG